MEKITVYKVIEERMSPSGRIEYFSLPLYKLITEEEIKGNTMYHPKETMKELMMHKWNIDLKIVRTNEDSFVHAFLDYDSAIDYMKKFFKGYLYVRPVIYECEAEVDESPNNVNYNCNFKSIKFLKPISYMTDYKVYDYVAMQKPEKKKPYSIKYDESEINGDTNYNE